MRITNRTAGTVTIKTSTSRDTPGNWIEWTWKVPGAYFDRGQGHDSVYVRVAPGKISEWDHTNFDKGWDKLMGSGAKPNAYSNKHSLLIVDGGRRIVDWSVVRDKYLGPGSLTDVASSGDPVAPVILKVATAVFSALSTGFSATGPTGAVPAGLFSLFASMMSFTQEEPPQPPNIGEIKQAVGREVKRVIEKEFQKQKAEDAAVTFLGAQEWLLQRQRSFWSVEKAKRGPQTREGRNPEQVAVDFKDELKDWGAPGKDLTHQVRLLRSDPETAKWIIPAFIAGIGAYHQIARLYILEQVSREGISADTIENFQTDLEHSRNALIATSRAWNQYCDSLLQDEGIGGTPEGVQVKNALTLAFTGTTKIGPEPLTGMPGMPVEVIERLDTTPIGKALWSLREAHGYLADDLKLLNEDKPPKHFWKEPWARSAQAPQ